MNRLKPYIGPHPTDNTLTEYYLKSEVDKVIAEKDKEIAELKKTDCFVASKIIPEPGE